MELDGLFQFVSEVSVRGRKESRRRIEQLAVRHATITVFMHDCVYVCVSIVLLPKELFIHPFFWCVFPCSISWTFCNCFFCVCFGKHTCIGHLFLSLSLSHPPPPFPCLSFSLTLYASMHVSARFSACASVCASVSASMCVVLCEPLCSLHVRL